MDAEAGFHYQPLLGDKDIRLLKILESKPDSVLTCCLAHVSLDDMEVPPYDALSYTWQSPFLSASVQQSLNQDSKAEPGNDSMTIIVDKEAVVVSPNLKDALEKLSPIVPGFIWVDALCIDQTNLRERAEQVQLMGQVYTQARRVMVWLGPSSPCSPRAIDFLALLGANDHQPDRIQWVTQFGTDLACLATWEALYNFVSRTWWTRAWVIQEYVLGRDVTFVCGGDHLRGDDLDRASRLLFDAWPALFRAGLPRRANLNARVLDPLWNLLELRQRLRHDRTFKIGPLSLLSRTRHSLASDPRDRLFAKLGIIGAPLCAPDYTMHYMDIYKMFLERYVRQNKDLYIVCYAGMDFALESGRPWPTWLPHWNSRRSAYPLRGSWSGRRDVWPTFDASRGFQPVVSLSLEHNIFRCEGLVVDEVDGVQFDHWCSKPWEVKAGQQSRSRRCAYGGAGETFEALWRTLVANTNPRGSVVTANDAATWLEPAEAPRYYGLLFIRAFEEYDRLLDELGQEPGTITTSVRPAASNVERRWHGMRDLSLGGKLLRDLVRGAGDGEAAKEGIPAELCRKILEAPFSPGAEWASLEHSHGQALYRRRLFTTMGGYFGISTRSLRSGDKVCILRGSTVPVLLRPSDKQYEHVGEAYIHGMMNGEAVGCGAVKWTSFELR